MRTSNGQSVSLNGHSAHTTVDTRHVSKIEISLTPMQAEFIDLVMFQGLKELSAALKLVHDVALYHSDFSINEEEKAALFNLKILWEGFERIENEA